MVTNMSKKSKISETRIGSANFHISNSDVTFSVLDGEYGPTIRIESHSFGNAALTLNVYTDADSVRLLGKMLLKSSKYDFENKPYCEPASCADIQMNEDIE